MKFFPAFNDFPQEFFRLVVPVDRMLDNAVPEVRFGYLQLPRGLYLDSICADTDNGLPALQINQSSYLKDSRRSLVR